MNEQMFHLNAQVPNKGGPFLPGLKTRGILGRFGENLFAKSKYIEHLGKLSHATGANKRNAV